MDVWYVWNIKQRLIIEIKEEQSGWKDLTLTVFTQ